MKMKYFTVMVLVVATALFYSDLAVAQTANNSLDVVVTKGGNLTANIGKFVLLVIGVGGIVVAATGLKRILSKHNDEQTQQGGPLRFVIGLLLMAFPVIVGMTTGYFTSEEVDTQEIIKNPFE